MPSIKSILNKHCLAFVAERIKTIENGMKELQLSANEETKSSAGDKYETGRASIQLEIEKLAGQLNETRKMEQAMNQLGIPQADFVLPGHLVTTNHGLFYVAIGAGQFLIEGRTYFAVSPQSPIGKKLMGSKKGERFELNKKEFVVLDIE